METSQIEEYLEWCRHKRLTFRTLDTYKKSLYLLKDIVNNKSIEQVKQKLWKVAPAYQNKLLVIFKSFCKRHPQPFDFIFKEFKQLKIKRRPIDVLTDAEMGLMMNACNSDYERACIGLMIFLGLRVQEVCDLKGEQLEGNYLKIKRKGGNWQRLPLNSYLSGLLHKISKSQSWIFRNKRFPEKYIHHDVLRSWVIRIASRAGINKKVRPHLLRHSFATSVAAKGGSIRALQEIMGHEKVTTTERYITVLPQHLKATLDMIIDPIGIFKKEEAAHNGP